MLPDEQPDPRQIEIYRRMPAAKKWALAVQLYWMARDIKASALRNRHPDWSEAQVTREVRRIFLHART